MQVGDNLLCVSDNLKHCQCKLVEDHDEEALSSALRIIGSDRVGWGLELKVSNVTEISRVISRTLFHDTS